MKYSVNGNHLNTHIVNMCCCNAINRVLITPARLFFFFLCVFVLYVLSCFMYDVCVRWRYGISTVAFSLECNEDILCNTDRPQYTKNYQSATFRYEHRIAKRHQRALFRTWMVWFTTAKHNEIFMWISLSFSFLVLPVTICRFIFIHVPHTRNTPANPIFGGARQEIHIHRPEKKARNNLIRFSFDWQYVWCSNDIWKNTSFVNDFFHPVSHSMINASNFIVIALLYSHTYSVNLLLILDSLQAVFTLRLSPLSHETYHANTWLWR